MAKKRNSDYDWLVMVYLAGDNNLTEESVFSLAEMKQVPTDDRIAVIAQFDPRGSRIPTRRYLIKGERQNGGSAAAQPLTAADGTLGTDAVALAKPAITFREPRKVKGQARRQKQDDEKKDSEQDVVETDTGDPATLFDFISWSQQRYSAERHMVILAGHGAGTEEDFLLKDENPTSSSLSIPSLSDVFKAVQDKLHIKVDILGMDVCLMSMVEVCYELDGVVDYLVASESFSPAAGWPYRQILQRLQDDKDADTEALAKVMVGEYINFYDDYVLGGLSVDQSVLKVSASSEVVGAVKNLTKAIKDRLLEPSFRDAIILAHWESQSYNGELFVDLKDFCELLAARDGKAAKACRTVTAAIDNMVQASCFTGIENQFSKGVSIYFPWSDVVPSYAELAFAKDAGWIDFLNEYVLQTRRKPRGFKQGGKNEELLAFGSDRPPRVASAPSGSERFRKSEDRKSEDRGKNPIHSMRNPPITLVRDGLSECVRANPMAVQRLRAFSSIRPGNKRR